MTPIEYRRYKDRVLPDGPTCVVCGRPLREVRLEIHVGLGGSHAVTDEESPPGNPGDMGMLPIGPCCLRRQPALRPYTRAVADGGGFR